jgi:hypothetical protein
MAEKADTEKGAITMGNMTPDQDTRVAGVISGCGASLAEINATRAQIAGIGLRGGRPTLSPWIVSGLAATQEVREYEAMRVALCAAKTNSLIASYLTEIASYHSE